MPSDPTQIPAETAAIVVDTTARPSSAPSAGDTPTPVVAAPVDSAQAPAAPVAVAKPSEPQPPNAPPAAPMAGEVRAEPKTVPGAATRATAAVTPLAPVTANPPANVADTPSVAAGPSEASKMAAAVAEALPTLTPVASAPPTATTQKLVAPVFGKKAVGLKVAAPAASSIVATPTTLDAAPVATASSEKPDSAAASPLAPTVEATKPVAAAADLLGVSVAPPPAGSAEPEVAKTRSNAPPAEIALSTSAKASSMPAAKAVSEIPQAATVGADAAKANAAAVSPPAAPVAGVVAVAPPTLSPATPVAAPLAATTQVAATPASAPAALISPGPAQPEALGSPVVAPLATSQKPVAPVFGKKAHGIPTSPPLAPVPLAAVVSGVPAPVAAAPALTTPPPAATAVTAMSGTATSAVAQKVDSTLVTTACGDVADAPPAPAPESVKSGSVASHCVSAAPTDSEARPNSQALPGKQTPMAATHVAPITAPAAPALATPPPAAKATVAVPLDVVPAVAPGSAAPTASLEMARAPVVPTSVAVAEPQPKTSAPPTAEASPSPLAKEKLVAPTFGKKAQGSQPEGPVLSTAGQATPTTIQAPTAETVLAPGVVATTAAAAAPELSTPPLTTVIDSVSSGPAAATEASGALAPVAPALVTVTTNPPAKVPLATMAPASTSRGPDVVATAPPSQVPAADDAPDSTPVSRPLPQAFPTAAVVSSTPLAVTLPPELCRDDAVLAGLLTSSNSPPAAPSARVQADIVLAGINGPEGNKAVRAVPAALDASLDGIVNIEKQKEKCEARADDNCLGTLLNVPPRVVAPQPSSHGIPGRTQSKPSNPDDELLSKLLRPTQAEHDDAVLAAQLSGEQVQVQEVLEKITRLKAKRAQEHLDEEHLAHVVVGCDIAPAFGSSAKAGKSTTAAIPSQLPAVLRVPRVRCVPVHNSDAFPGSLCYYASLGDVTSVRYLCEQARLCGDRFLVNGTDGNGRTALHHAAFEGSLEVADMLLQAGADPLQRDTDERNALHVAASRGKDDVASIILGACVYRLRTTTLRQLRTMRFGVSSNVGWVASGRSGYDSADDIALLEETAAHECLAGYLRGLEDLRHNLVMAEDRFGHNPGHYALRDSYGGCVAVLRLLLTSFVEFADPGQVDSIMYDSRYEAQPGPTLLCTLSALLPTHVVDALRREHRKRSLSIRNEMLNGLDSRGFAPLHYAATEGNYRAVQLLVSLGANLGARVNPRTDDGLVGFNGSGGADFEALRGATPFQLARDVVTRHALASYPANCSATLEAQATTIVTLLDGNCDSVNRDYGIMARTPLHEALFSAVSADAKKLDAPMPIVAELLRKHPECDPLLPDANGWTAMHYACAYGRGIELEQLLERAKRLHPELWSRKVGKENVNHTSQKVGVQRSFSKRQAGETGQLQDLRVLVNRRPPSAQRRSRSSGYGGGVFAPPPAQARAGGQLAGANGCLGSLMGRTPTHLAAQVAGEDPVSAALGTNGALNCLEALDRYELLDLEAQDDRGMTPLLVASYAGSAAAVSWLLHKRADCYKEDNMKQNALHLAAQRGHHRVIRLLLRYDADCSRLRSGQDWKGRRADEVAQSGRGRRLNGRFDGEDMGDDFVTIWEAARSGDLDQLHSALRTGAPLDAASVGGWTPAMYAAASGHLAILRHLIELRCSCDPPTQTKVGLERPEVRPAHGRGPLHLAAEQGHADICVMLVRAKAGLEIHCARGLTPLLAACSMGHRWAAEELLALGADVGAEVVVGSDGFDDRGGGVFAVLVRGGPATDERRADCIRWLAARLIHDDPWKALDLLERGTSRVETPRASKDARTPSGTSRTHSALARALRAANIRCGSG